MIASAVLAALLLLAVAIYIAQPALVFFPERAVPSTPAEFGLAYEPVALRTADGVALGAWWVPAEAARGALVLCHGNAGNIAHRVDKAVLFHELGLSVLLFDYRGYGTSGGRPTERGTYMDMDSAVEHVREVRGVPPERTLFWGESIGASVAVEAATRNPCGGIILESGFTCVPAMAKTVYPWLPTFFVRFGYDSLARIRSVKAPKLILHGPADEIVPYRMGRELYEAAPEPKRFADLRGGHNDGGILVSPEAQEALRQFLGEVLPPAQP